MHSKLKRAAAEAARAEQLTERLERLLNALAEDLAEASDEEVLQACADLGMNPEMRGSAAFFGLKGASVSVEEFFDLDELQRLHLTALRARGITSQGRAAAHPGRTETAKADEEDGEQGDAD